MSVLGNPNFQISLKLTSGKTQFFVLQEFVNYTLKTVVEESAEMSILYNIALWN